MLIPILQPAVVRETIKKEQPFCPSDKSYDLKHFQRKVVETSRKAAKYTGKRGRTDAEDGHVANAGNFRKQKKSRKSSDNAVRKTAVANAGRANAGALKDRKKRAGAAASVSPEGTEWMTPCLNEDCGEIHPLRCSPE